jgi:hypothetical protein
LNFSPSLAKGDSKVSFGEKRRGVSESESMAEIKSTLELAMERTKKIAISEKEKEEIKRKEFAQKMKGLSQRFMAGHLSLNEILRQIERMDEKTSSEAIEALVCQWVDALSLSEESEKLFGGIESLKHRSLDDIRQKNLQLASQYRREKETLKAKVIAQLAETLRTKGIDGSAVEPNFESSSPWKRGMEDLNRLYDTKLEEIKKELRQL